MKTYYAQLRPEPEGGFTVLFRDVPAAITCGDMLGEALYIAEDCLATALDGETDVPTPSAKQPGDFLVPVRYHRAPHVIGNPLPDAWSPLDDGGFGKRIETKPFDAADHLRNAEDDAAYLESAEEDGDPELLERAKATVARARARRAANEI